LSRLTLALGLALLLVEAAAGVALIAIDGQDDLSWAGIAVEATAGAAFVVSGLIALARRPENRTGMYLAATGYIWFLGALTHLDDEWLFAIGYAFVDFVWVTFTALVLVYPTGRFASRLERSIPLAVAALLVLTNGFKLLFDPTPAQARCDDCPGSPIVISDRPDVADAVNAFTSFAGLVVIGLVVVILARRWRRATAASRRLLWPVVGAGLATLVALALLLVADQFSETAAEIAQVLALVTFAIVPFSFLFGVLRTRLARSSVSELLVGLDRGVPLREALAGALGDPSLEIVYRLDWRRGAGWVDDHGRPVPEPAAGEDRSVRFVEHEGEHVAALLHDAVLDAEGERVDAVTKAAGLTLLNQRLQAELRAEVAFVWTVTATAPSLLVNVDTEGRIRNVNKAALEASGRESEDAVTGQHFWDVFISDDEREDVKVRFAEAAPEFPPTEYENTFTNARGETLTIYWRGAPVLDELGQVVSIIAGGLDITERHRLEAEKEREREFLNAIANNAPSLLCLVDDQGRVTERGANKAFERTLERDPSDIGGEIFWIRYAHPSSADEIRERFERVVAGETLGEHDSYWVTGTGRRLLIAWTCTPLPQVDERRLFLITGVDVTERSRRELEIQAARDFLQTVVTTIPSLLVVVDSEARILEDGVNREFTETFGWSAWESTGRSFLELVHPDDEYAVRMAIAAAANGVPRTDLEARWLRQDGDPAFVAWTATPTRDREGRAQVLLSGMDITERRRREEEIRAGEERLRAAIESAPVAIIEVGHDLRVRLWNPTAESIFGWSREEVLGAPLPIVPPELEDDFRGLLERTREGEAVTGIETVRLRKDGSRVDVEVSAAPIRDASGAVAGYMAVFGDISDRKLQDEEIRASRARIVAAGDDARRKLERNLHDGAQQRLVALSVSLRLAETKLTADPAGAAGILAGARGELMHALEELRELARGIHPAILTDRGLEPAIEALVARTPVPVEVDVRTGDLPPAVEAASYYVVAEALTNVAKYAAASAASVRIARDDGRLTIEVADNGIGGADSGQGSGLRGLADRLAALDGTLSIDSPSGGGTAVRAEIPLSAAAE
jgi:PAS domain S-box-containing protein